MLTPYCEHGKHVEREWCRCCGFTPKAARECIDDGADCEDQALTPTEVCQNWECTPVALVVDACGYWKCPRCGGSYGKHAKG